MRVRLRSPLIPLLALFALTLQLVEPSRAWTILLVAFGGATLAAFLWGNALARNLHLTRERHVGWLQVGGQIEEKLTLRNTALLPAAWIHLRDHSTLPGYNINATFTVGAGDFLQWDTRGDCRQRGLFTLGQADLETGDPFGIFSFAQSDSSRASVMILPSLAALPPFAVTPAGFGGDGQRRARLHEISQSASNVRAYQPNDSLRLIHWPTTARQGQLFVRQFDSAPAGDWWILLDLNRAANVGEGLDSTTEAAVTLAASLAQRGLDEQKRVGLLVNAAEPLRLAPQSGEAQRWEIMQALAAADSSPLSLARFLERARNFIHQRASLLIVTADASADWLAALQPLVTRGLAPTAFLLDPASFGARANASARGMAGLLRQRGLASHLVTREALRPERGGNERWTWQRSSAGFVPVRIPSSAATREKR
jgi:uncharacterized protein (DUF58 family)